LAESIARIKLISKHTPQGYRGESSPYDVNGQGAATQKSSACLKKIPIPYNIIKH